MADSNHLSARADELADDDPFAELTRIMGQGSFVRPQPVDDMEALGLDLEKELLGDFSDEQGATSEFSEDSQTEFDVADAFGEEDFASNLFKGTGLDDFEQALSAEPVFENPEPAPVEDIEPPYMPDDHYQVGAYEADYAAEASDDRDTPVEHGTSPDTSIFGNYREPETFEPEAPAYVPETEATYEEPSAAVEPEQYSVSNSPFDLTGAIFSLRDNYGAPQDRYSDTTDQADQFGHEHTSMQFSGEPELQQDHSQYALDDSAPEFDDVHNAFESALQDLSPADETPHHTGEATIEDELEKALGLSVGWDVGDRSSIFAADEPQQTPSYEEADFSWTAESDEQRWEDEQQTDVTAAAAASTVTAAAAATAWTSEWKASGNDAGFGQAASDQEGAEAESHSYNDDYAQHGEQYAQDDDSWTEQAEEPQWVDEQVTAEPPVTAYGQSYDGPPEIETVEIPEKAVAVTETLDIPDVPYQEEVKSSAQLDDIEELLSGAFGSLDQSASANEWEPQQGAQEQQQSDSVQDDFDELLTAGLAAASAAALARNNYSPAEPQFDQGWNDGYEQAPRPMPGTPPPAAASGGIFSRRNKTIAALLAGVAIIGIGSVFALNQFGGGGGEAVIITADSSPIKEKPENPGGTTVPNQDSQVYRQVAGETPEPGSGQTQLVSSAEEPVELSAPADEVEEVLAQQDELLPQEVALSEAMAAETAVKNEERLVSTGEEAGQSESFTMLTPRRVRSYVVRPDGTMVPREVETPTDTADASGALPGVNADRVEVAAAGAPAAANASQDDGLVAGQEIPPLGAAPAELEQFQQSAGAGSMPQSAPIPAPRPANVARTNTAPTAQTVPSAPATVAPTQVAAAQPAAPAASAAASGWSVQIASQPTLEAAQQSYQSLAQRYGTMLQGKGVNIVKAEVQGKGTYYRVRIPASSKNDAISLCESLKTQGGSCFVSQ